MAVLDPVTDPAIGAVTPTAIPLFFAPPEAGIPVEAAIPATPAPDVPAPDPTALVTAPPAGPAALVVTPPAAGPPAVPAGLGLAAGHLADIAPAAGDGVPDPLNAAVGWLTFDPFPLASALEF